ncbi:FdhF/YdeP family oxidoreductase [Martelella mediterranea]|uniref:Formate dehydrogenase F4A subunit n=1 Tax=Martelella mediterranea TaxID=293089 RepID=A0A4R3NV51_9HYPH|nr:FdhF/YdeP family oxidoreductase [Martelella mediterranea]TCT40942.1 formate dehydrogenase F4A subunit [Martelella mediterranea]
MERDPNSGHKSKAAGGWPALIASGKFLLSSGAPLSGVNALKKANQPDGFDCPGCAWGDPEHGSSFEFCENGVKAVSWEATERHADPVFFARHSVSTLKTWSDHDLENSGRLTEPMRYNASTDHYEPVSWETAFHEIGELLNSLDTPDEALFYTSGRASNEAAYVYQLFARIYGTNNMPDCSNMCHEASGVALKQAIGIGKGTVRLEDFEKADAIFVVGQNPGTNHPRMLGDLRRAAERGARIAVFNTLRERGLERFADPQRKMEMVINGSKKIASDYFQPALGGDMAVFRGMAKAVITADRKSRSDGNGPLIDEAFIAKHTQGFESYIAEVDQTRWEDIEAQSGLSRAEIEKAARIYLSADNVICTWAMGITQHKHSVITIREIASFMMLRGQIGRPGAGLCPVRGHSNVQGDRTMGINEKPPAAFLDALSKTFGFEAPREHGYSTIGAIGAMLAGKARAFVGLGGNFGRAVPDSSLIENALREQLLTVQIATKLNASHTMPGRNAYLLPCLGRTEIDLGPDGKPQLITVEDSMSMIHGSAGINTPAGPQLRSEIAIVTGIAAATVGTDVVNWPALSANYDRIRDYIAKTIPGFSDFNKRVRQPRGFYLGNSAAERKWDTDTGLANFCDCALPESTVFQKRGEKKDYFTLQTVRSHDQYNTTVYGMDDRYRGVYGERRIIFINPADITDMGARAHQFVDIEGPDDDGVERIARSFKLIPYDIPRGCLAGYFPELNVLVPLSSFGDLSETPTSKSIPVRLKIAQTEAVA